MGFINYRLSIVNYQRLFVRRICLLALLIIMLGGCKSEKPLLPTDAHAAQQQVTEAWTKPLHGIWELTWTAMPIEGTLVFEAWTTQNATRQCFEILEASSPALVGMAYVNTGKRAAVFNRLEADEPIFDGDVDTPFSPITDARTFIELALAQSPQSAAMVGDGSYIFYYADGRSLRVSFDLQTGNIHKITLKTLTDELTLKNRMLESPASFPDALFIIPKN